MDWNKTFEYRDGLLYRRQDPNRAQRFNTRWAGKLAGRFRADGYYTLGLNYKSYLGHRIIWEMFNGPIPCGMEVDHIDGNPSNNKIENLRLATRQQNGFNLKRRKNRHGYKGVIFNNGKYRARIFHMGKTRYVGNFDTAKEAGEAYFEAAKRLFGKYATRYEGAS